MVTPLNGIRARFESAVNILLPKKLPNVGVAVTPTYSVSSSDNILPVIGRDSHTRNILDFRQSTSDSEIVKDLARTDSDVSATVSAYLAVCNTPMRYLCYTQEGAVDREAQAKIGTVLTNLTSVLDYTAGFTADKSLNHRNAMFRYHLLVSGACCGELIQDKKTNTISEFRIVNPDTLEWKEKDNGSLKPSQNTGSTESNDLDIVTFFYTAHHQDPNTAYSVSPFVSVINSIYARKRIIEDLYRMMSINGYPRIKIKVLEETIMKNAPDNVKRSKHAADKQNYLQGYMNSISSAFQNVKADQPLVHSDSYEVDVMNQKGAMAIDISPIIDILNSQNQTALKTVGTILGRGENGVNTASVETRVFLKSAEDFNTTLANLWSQALTFALRLSGSKSRVSVYFDKPSFNTDVEDSPNRVVKQSMLLKDLSLGIITDDEYALYMYNRLSNEGVELLSGTRFLDNTSTTEIVETPNDPRNQPDSYSRSSDM